MTEARCLSQHRDLSISLSSPVSLGCYGSFWYMVFAGVIPQ